MKKFLYGLYDKKSAQVLTEFTEWTDEAAIRSFIYSLSTNPFYRGNASDFELLRICSFESLDGHCDSTDGSPIGICTGNPHLVKSFLKKIKEDSEDESERKTV